MSTTQFSNKLNPNFHATTLTLQLPNTTSYTAMSHLTSPLTQPFCPCGPGRWNRVSLSTPSQLGHAARGVWPAKLRPTLSVSTTCQVTHAARHALGSGGRGSQCGWARSLFMQRGQLCGRTLAGPGKLVEAGHGVSPTWGSAKWTISLQMDRRGSGTRGGSQVPGRRDCGHQVCLPPVDTMLCCQNDCSATCIHVSIFTWSNEQKLKYYSSFWYIF